MAVKLHDTNEIKGLAMLGKRLEELGGAMGIQTLRHATSAALEKTYRQVKAAAPKGTKPHKTFKGRTVFPGFLARSVKKRSRTFKREGRVQASIGVLKEAFYGIQFLDVGVVVTKRRKGGKGGSAGGGKAIKPYTIPARHWFRRRLYENRKQIEETFAIRLRERIDKVTRTKT